MTCGRPTCEICLAGAEGPEAFSCPACGGLGAALYDADLGGLEDAVPRS